MNTTVQHLSQRDATAWDAPDESAEQRNPFAVWLLLWASSVGAMRAGFIVGLQRLARITLIASSAALIAGCSIFSGSEPDETIGWSASRLYSEAQSELSGNNWERAISLFEKLQSRYPFGRFAQQALMEIAYAHYKDSEPAQARAAADRFIRLYPNHPNVDYMFYLRGLISFNDNLGILASIARQDPSERDPKALRDSFDAFRELIARFPKSRYAEDSFLRLQYLVNALAKHEIHVADYYMRRGAWLAAANRAQGVLRNYQQTPAVEDALYVMVKSYDALKLETLRDDALRVLKTNFPNSTIMTTGLVKAEKRWWQIW